MSAVPDNIVVEGPWAIQQPGCGTTDLVRLPDAADGKPIQYQGMYAGHALHGAYGGRLGVNYRITTTGDHFGKVVIAWYKVKILDKNRGQFSVSRHSKFARDWRVLFQRSAERWDRVPMSALRDFGVRMYVETVTRDHEQQALEPINQYSKVSEILGRVDG